MHEEVTEAQGMRDVMYGISVRDALSQTTSLSSMHSLHHGLVISSESDHT